MKGFSRISFAAALIFTNVGVLHAENCSGRAQDYQERYESTGQVQDLICMTKAMQREMSGDSRVYNCSRSAQYYQTAYESYGRAGDLVCMQQALEREMQ